MSTDAAMNLAHTLTAETVRNPLLPPIGVIVGIAVAVAVVFALIAIVGIVIAVVHLRRDRR